MQPHPLAPRRPRVHFAAPAGWLNDPNGLVYLDGEYHLFYQHHPGSLVWGPMHWGHAVSRDLVQWEQLPIALAPDEQGMIFSGSAVVDSGNTAGFGAGALVAIFTHHRPGREVQSLAFSTDRGRSWEKYTGNPVLAPADAPPDFRDPRVLWYEGAGGGHWVMLLAVGQETWFYTSPDLKRWRKVSSFGAGHSAHSGVLECPELVCLPVDGGPERRWVLVVGVQRGGPAGGSGVRYFVGSFDGESFTSDDPPDVVRWADYGADFYAAQAWQNAPGGRTLWLAWMSNWAYARETPAATWRGMMSAPRELALASDGGQLRLVQRLTPELTAGWPAPQSFRDLTIPAGRLALDGVRGEILLLEATFDVSGAAARSLGLRVRVGGGAGIAVGYDREREELYLDRSQAWWGSGGQVIQAAPLAPRDGLVRINILVDTASVEVFADEGRVVLTSQAFPPPDCAGVELFAEGGAARLAELKVRAPSPPSTKG